MWSDQLDVYGPLLSSNNHREYEHHLKIAKVKVQDRNILDTFNRFKQKYCYGPMPANFVGFNFSLPYSKILEILIFRKDIPVMMFFQKLDVMAKRIKANIKFKLFF
jgi:hypothetical protein